MDNKTNLVWQSVLYGNTILHEISMLYLVEDVLFWDLGQFPIIIIEKFWQPQEPKKRFLDVKKAPKALSNYN